MVRKSKSWGGIATSMTKSDFLFRPSASLPKSFHRSGRGKSSKSRVWHLKTPAPPKCSCSSAGTIALWQVPCHNWSPSNPTNPPRRPLATGTTGWRRDTVSEPRRPGRYCAALPKAHELLASVPLLIIDDLGMRKLPATAAEELLEIVMRRHYVTLFDVYQCAISPPLLEERIAEAEDIILGRHYVAIAPKVFGERTADLAGLGFVHDEREDRYLAPASSGLRDILRLRPFPW